MPSAHAHDAHLSRASSHGVDVAAHRQVALLEGQRGAELASDAHCATKCDDAPCVAKSDRAASKGPASCAAPCPPHAPSLATVCNNRLKYNSRREEHERWLLDQAMKAAGDKRKEKGGRR